jgi:hypothetical protein
MSVLGMASADLRPISSKLNDNLGLVVNFVSMDIACRSPDKEKRSQLKSPVASRCSVSLVTCWQITVI